MYDLSNERSENRDLLKFYEYDRSIPLNVSEEVYVEGLNHIIYKVYFDSTNGERVPALLSIPKGEGKFPCIIFLHGYGGSKEDVVSFAGLAASSGYALIAIDAEYHGERREEGKALYSTDLEDSRRGIIQTIIDLRRAVDYVETRPEIDGKRIGYVGGSMGGILGAIFIGVEPRIKAAALLVTGGNMSLMIMKSEHSSIPPIREYLKKKGISYGELQKILDPVEPLNFIRNFSPRPVVFHLGRLDRIVPAEAGEQLYKRAGYPKNVYWYDAGHILPLDLVVARILDFMDRELMGKTMVFHEAKYWLSKFIIPVIIIAAIILTVVIAWRRGR